MHVDHLQKKIGLDRTNLEGSYFKNIFDKISIFLGFFARKTPETLLKGTGTIFFVILHHVL